MAETPQIPLRDPRIAALLAFLVPGLGHFYQRRIFKGVLYSVCIMGTFFAGMVIGDWKVVYFNWGNRDRFIPPICQFWNGLPFLPAVIQARRAQQANLPTRLNESTAGEFQGILGDISSVANIQGGEIKGHLEIEPNGRGFTGSFQGLLMDQYPIQGKVQGGEIDPKISPFPNRHVNFDLIGTIDFDGKDLDFNGYVSDGHLPRSLFDTYAAPLHDNPNITNPTDLEVANDYLGRYFDLGTLYTMIAGLLNVLAIYDAYEGPAYGYGDEEDETDPEKPTEKPNDKETQTA